MSGDAKWLVDLVESYGEALGRVVLLPIDRSLIKTSPLPIDKLKRHRDSDWIIGQTQEPPDTWDGGDSAHKTGVLAFCGSEADQGLLVRFEDGNGTMVRHPKEYPWNNPKNCSRDQLIAFTAGCWRAGQTSIAQRLLREHEARGYFCQNTERDEPGSTKNGPADPLLPHEQMFLRVCAGNSGAHWDLVGQTMLQAVIEAVPHQPANIEINQLILECVVCARLDHFVKFVPDYRRRLNLYWGSRDQQEIADVFAAVVEIELTRYSGFVALPFPPFPMGSAFAAVKHIELIYDAATHINWWKDPNNLAQIPVSAVRLFEAAISDGVAQAKYYVETIPRFVSLAGSLVDVAFGGFDVRNLISGDDSERRHSEIMAALREIDQKLQEIIRFLKNDLAFVVNKAVLDAIASHDLLLAEQYYAVWLKPALDQLRSHPNDTTASAVCNAVIQITTLVNTAIASGASYSHRERFLLLVILAAGNDLLRYSRRTYEGYLRDWANAISGILEKYVLDQTYQLSMASLFAKLPSLDELNKSYNQIHPTANSLNVFFGVQIRPAATLGTYGLVGWIATLKINLQEPSKPHWDLTVSTKVGTSGVMPKRPTAEEARDILGLREYGTYSWFGVRENVDGTPDEVGQELRVEADKIIVNSKIRDGAVAVSELLNDARSVNTAAKDVVVALGRG